MPSERSIRFARQKGLKMLTVHEANALTGRVFQRTADSLVYTVTSASTKEDIHVWDPRTETMIYFDSRETFEHWAYGTPVSTKVASQ